MAMRRMALATSIAAVCLAVAGAASGHRLVAIGETFPSQTEALRIEALDVSQVAYVELTAEEPELWIGFDVNGPTDLFLSLGLPRLDRLVDDRPQIRVVRATSDGTTEVAAYDTGSVDAPRLFHEPFTGTDSWILLEETVVLREPGTYFLVAAEAEAEAGKLWVSVGRREAFSVADVLSFPSVVRRVRAFHEVGRRGPAPIEWATLLGFAVLAAVVVVAATRD